jgi:hypothetical protein
VERRKMRARGVEVAGQGPFIEGEGVGCLLFDWLGWVAAHLIVGVVERQVLQEKKVRRKVAGRNFLAMAGSFLTTTSEQTKCNATS